MIRKVVLVAAALGGALAIGILVALVREDTKPPARAFQVDGALSPTAASFGDTVRATLTVAIDPARIEPGSVRVEPRVAPFNLAGPVTRTASDDQGAVEIRHVFPLLCLRAACLPREAGAMRIFSLRARIDYRLGGRNRTSMAVLGALVVRSRMVSRGASEPAWRLELAGLDLDARLPPALLAALLAACSLAAAATAILLLLRLAGRVEVGAPPAPASMGTGLERALRLLRDAVARGTPASQRRALDRLARELAVAEGARLEGEARRLAWSRQGPVGSRVARLEKAVETLVQRAT